MFKFIDNLGQKAPHELSDSDAEDDEDEKAALAEFEGEMILGQMVQSKVAEFVS